jgi:branched-chain amino acid transport system permease protein
MNLQFLADGLLSGMMIGLGAIGVTVTYSILRFANFAHGELLTSGAYAAWAASFALTALAGGAAPPLGPFSFGWTVLVGGVFAMLFSAALALAIDAVLFRRLRKGASIVVVMASFGASLALRSLIEFVFSSSPVYFSQELQISRPLGFGVRVTPDQLALIGVTAVLLVGVHLLMTRSQAGRSMRAVSENPTLARVVGVNVEDIVRLTWILGGALAAAAGAMTGILVQIRPYMGFDLLLPLFSAAILGGIGSVPGAIVGGIAIGIAEAATVDFIGSQWRAAVSFLLLIAMLLVRPRGLFGGRA